MQMLGTNLTTLERINSIETGKCFLHTEAFNILPIFTLNIVDENIPVLAKIDACLTDCVECIIKYHDSRPDFLATLSSLEDKNAFRKCIFNWDCTRILQRVERQSYYLNLLDLELKYGIVKMIPKR